MISEATNVVNKVAVVDVKDTTFNVTFEAVPEASQGYIVEIYSNSVLIENITSASNNVLVSNVNPYSQEYFVRIAFVTAFATSDYSAQVSSCKYLYTSYKIGMDLVGVSESESMVIQNRYISNFSIIYTFTVIKLNCYSFQLYLTLLWLKTQEYLSHGRDIQMLIFTSSQCSSQIELKSHWQRIQLLRSVLSTYSFEKLLISKFTLHIAKLFTYDMKFQVETELTISPLSPGITYIIEVAAVEPDATQIRLFERTQITSMFDGIHSISSSNMITLSYRRGDSVNYFEPIW